MNSPVNTYRNSSDVNTNMETPRMLSSRGGDHFGSCSVQVKNTSCAATTGDASAFDSAPKSSVANFHG